MSNRSEFNLVGHSQDRCGECGHSNQNHSEMGCRLCTRMQLHCSGFRSHTEHDFPLTDKGNISKLLGVLDNTLDSINFWLDTAVISDANPKIILDKSTYKRIKEYVRQSQNIKRTLTVLNNKGE